MEREKNERKKDGTCCVGPLAILANKLWQKSSKRWMKRSRTREKKRQRTQNRSIRSIILIVLCFVSFAFYITLIAYWIERYVVASFVLRRNAWRNWFLENMTEWGVILRRKQKHQAIVPKYMKCLFGMRNMQTCKHQLAFLPKKIVQTSPTIDTFSFWFII